MERRQIPVPGLENYRIDSGGQVFRMANPLKLKDGKPPYTGPEADTALKGVTFQIAMDTWAGAKNRIDKVPWLLMPGVWQLRFIGDLEKPQFMSGSMQAYFERHALGPKRIHPIEWPPWGANASAAAAAFVDTARDAKCWFMIRLPNLNPPMSLARQQHLETYQPAPDGSREYYPFLVMGKIAFAAIEPSVTL